MTPVASGLRRDPFDAELALGAPALLASFNRAGVLVAADVHAARRLGALLGESGEAVLLRSVEPVNEQLGDTRGPGRLCRAFHLTRQSDGSSAVNGVQLRVLPGPRSREPVVSGPRVGISRAQRRYLRFALKGNRWVSSPRPPGWAG